MSHKIMRLPEVIKMTGLSRSTIYLRMSKGSFPLSISLGERAVGWLETDIEQWLEKCVAVSKGVNHD
ncbi:AlpA family transcriptional regulator [Vibrio vulnificus]|uniref:helix-turn-helix transcriptional regulator n=1 Tax=Vibrio vulnificus TaxID=672 RepID=UPI000CD13ED4|nr:AlpA family transcriptional regulator [Vibrio vulnificus]EHH0683512.1 AlpA family transcriptional regulator [Vibrio vulnificus]EHU4867585.1 AlpA family transcriptional regulator [Vibrio vulnificus]EHV9036700.1 AlpA family transcriptional regulator [Vibrio vulnificus]EIA1323164.1 AlpA family transcriptional regulator [Vibrio vulnificus]EIT7120846.1 AlpA family transcriptional regulator [Vibrio vulnificus]